MRFAKYALLAGASALTIRRGTDVSTQWWFAPKQTQVVEINDSDLIAGGFGQQTPMSKIYATNITPGVETGIGHYDYGDFERAMRQGMRPDGAHLCPSMPYASCRAVSDADIQALYACCMSLVVPMLKANQPATIPWPVAWWNMLFSSPRSFTPPENVDPVLTRGACLVEGLAQCGACHTPRGLAFEEKALREDAAGRFLSGSVLEGWYDLHHASLSAALDCRSGGAGDLYPQFLGKSCEAVSEGDITRMRREIAHKPNHFAPEAGQ